MGSGVNCFLVILCPVLILMNLQLNWKFVVGPRYMDICDLLGIVFVGGASSCVSAYVLKSTLQCLD